MFEAAQAERIAIDAALPRQPGDRAFEPLERDTELARIIGVPGQRLGTFARLILQDHLGVAGQPLRFDIRWNRLAQISPEQIDEQNAIIDKSFPPSEGNL